MLVASRLAFAVGCLRERTLAFADAACAADGARVCTVEEISNRCTESTGCGINYQWVWSNSTCESDLISMVMPRHFRFSPLTSQQCKSLEDWTWYDRSCSLKIQVDDDAMVTIVHTADDGLPENANNGYIYKASRIDSQNKFFVTWDGDAKPSAASGCGGSSDCEVIDTDVERSCLCSVTVEDTVVFTDALSVPSTQDVLAQLRVGAAPLDMYDADIYTLCTTDSCTCELYSVHHRLMHMCAACAASTILMHMCCSLRCRRNMDHSWWAVRYGYHL